MHFVGYRGVLILVHECQLLAFTLIDALHAHAATFKCGKLRISYRTTLQNGHIPYTYTASVMICIVSDVS